MWLVNPDSTGATVLQPDFEEILANVCLELTYFWLLNSSAVRGIDLESSLHNESGSAT